MKGPYESESLALPRLLVEDDSCLLYLSELLEVFLQSVRCRAPTEDPPRTTSRSFSSSPG